MLLLNTKDNNNEIAETKLKAKKLIKILIRSIKQDINRYSKKLT